jgi:hypothetical protein
MSLQVPLASFLGFAVDATWTAFFESSSLVIMGFAPEISLYARF